MANITLLGVAKVGIVLSPFILICFFVLSSVFNSDIKGIIFLGLLLFNCAITIGIGSILPVMKNDCVGIPLTDDGSKVSNLPLNVNILSFTLAYLAYIIGTYSAKEGNDSLVIKNIPTILVLSIMILATFANQMVFEGCGNPLSSVISLIIGGGLGALFSYAIDKSEIVQLQFFNGITSQEVCKRASNTKYKCTTRPKL